jgi:predicted Zn-dependent peptidase
MRVSRSNAAIFAGCLALALATTGRVVARAHHSKRPRGGATRPGTTHVHTRPPTTAPAPPAPPEGGGGPVAAFSARSDDEVVRIAAEKTRLANGLEVILHEDHTTPLVAVNLWYHVGSGNEVAGRMGFAHLFEHLMFEGSSHVAKNEFFARIEEAGGDLNGSTWIDATNYYEVLPANFLELALWLESDRMGYLLPGLDQSKLDNQRDVVKNERRQRYENAPYGMVRKKLQEALWPASHPYHHWTIGDHADLTAATLDDVKRFFLRYYPPSNATLVVAGDFDRANTLKLVEKYFGSLPTAPAPPRLQVPPLGPLAPGEAQHLTHPDRVQLPRVYLAWRSPAFFAAGDAALDLLASVLSGGKGSRLYKSLVYDQRIAQDVHAVQSSAMVGSTFEIVATAKPGHTLDELVRAIDAELARLRAEPVTPRELERAKNQYEVDFVRRLGSVGDKANQLNHYNHFLGTPERAGDDLTRYRAVTAEAMRQAARQWLDPARRIQLDAIAQGVAQGTAP